MPKIVHRCPKCKKALHTEPEDRYFDNTSGCSLGCPVCGIDLIVVDLSVCLKKCSPYKKNLHDCGTKLCTLTEPIT